MAIKWFNIRSKEVRVAETEPQITAMWASSDRSPNITQGQDFGWRLAPEVVVEMKKIKQNPQALQEIATRYMRPLEDVGEPDILQYISDNTNAQNAPVAQEGDYQDEYDAEVRRLEREAEEQQASAVPHVAAPVGTPTESLEDLEKRVQLEERLAAAKEKSLKAEQTIAAQKARPPKEPKPPKTSDSSPEKQ